MQLRLPGGHDPQDEGDEVPPEFALEVEEVLEVLQGAPLPIHGLLVPQVVVIFRVDVAVVS